MNESFQNLKELTTPEILWPALWKFLFFILPFSFLKDSPRLSLSFSYDHSPNLSPSPPNLAFDSNDAPSLWVYCRTALNLSSLIRWNLKFEGGTCGLATFAGFSSLTSECARVRLLIESALCLLFGAPFFLAFFLSS